MTSTDVAVIGAGAIGTSVAWRCAQRGLSVTIIDPAPERGAWQAAAGMLAPITELHYAETELLQLSLAALARYPAVVDELTAVTGIDVGYRQHGTLAAAWDAADLVTLRELAAFGRGLGLTMQPLTGAELHELEPALAPGLPGGVLAPSDHQVDPRQLHRATLRAAITAGATLRTATASVRVERGAVCGVDLDDGATITAGRTVLTAGAWSASISGLDDSARPQTRPVKGHTVHLTDVGELRHVVRGRVGGNTVYVVPRDGGRAVVGATTEEAGFDTSTRLGAVYELLRDAQTVVPMLGEARLGEISTGLRPGSPDNAPLLGPATIDGLIVATGHYRNGILLAPITGDIVADLVSTGTLPELADPFRPGRFRSEVLG
jgi:glycine oxidase